MVDEYPPDKLWKLYEVLPKELQHVLFSEETANTIFEICKRNNLEESKMSELAKYVGYTLLGVLPPEEFENTIKEKLNLPPEKTKEINHEINRFIFFPVKNFLELIYGQKSQEGSLGDVKKSSEVEQKPKEFSKDIYREPIE